ncbi:ATP-dependent zinc protease [Pseudohalioglobus lutimaris]|uniref:ATP-dependent zinc protease n=1 Tax=Pseudohalioglobus lutimaris TaxID=1737061 RepID=A0A2N5X4B0_9GAMM|nr:ATP-dependent zinc protease [Pseudohalioglobus lutimaris]PLW69326.1 ATP-dependent zinc protease [Pseudohalioglobus lutimaris]
MSENKLVLGWREWLAFPELGIVQIKAKVDTGARTSCLHAYFVEPFERSGEAWVRFGIHPRQGNTKEEIHCEARVKDRRSVRDSGGHEELRYVIETPVSIGDQHTPVEVTLTDRDTMKFRVLLGRSGIGEQYVVDPARSYVQGKRKRRSARKGAR